MLPNKLQHGDNLANLFEKFNTVIDYLREIRLVAGNGIRINRLPAGTTIESTATSAGGTPAAPAGIWSAQVEKNYRDYDGSRIPYAVIFHEARRIFHGLMQDSDLILRLPSSAVSDGTIYIYATDQNISQGPVLRWTASSSLDWIRQPGYNYLPIRYICKIIITNGEFRFENLPTDTVVFNGGYNDPVRLIVQWTTNTWNQDMLNTMEPGIVYLGNYLYCNPGTGNCSDYSPQYSHIELSSYSELGSSLYIVAGYWYSLRVIPSNSVIGDDGRFRVIAKLGEKDQLGFRSVSWQDPVYSIWLSSRGYAFNGHAIELKQRYIDVDGSISELNKTVSTGNLPSKVTVYADFDFLPSSAFLGTHRLRLSTETTDNPNSGYTRLTYTVGEIYPASVGTAKVIMFNDLISPRFETSRIAWVISDFNDKWSNLNTSTSNLNTRTSNLESRMDALERRVTALENK